MKPNWDRIDARLAHQMFSWNFDVILSLYIGFGAPDVRQFCPSLVSFRFSLWIDENVTMTQKPT
jgi:hypothetical protein